MDYKTYLVTEIEISVVLLALISIYQNYHSGDILSRISLLSYTINFFTTVILANSMIKNRKFGKEFMRLILRFTFFIAGLSLISSTFLNLWIHHFL